MQLPPHTHAPAHVAAWHQDMFAMLAAHGISANQLIGNTGLRLSDLSDDQPHVSFATLAEVLERAAALTGNDLFGLELGQKRDMRRLGLMAFVGQSAPTVASLLRSMARYQRVFGDAININVHDLDRRGTVSWDFNVPEAVEQRQYIEFDGAGLVQWLRGLTGRRIVPAAVTFRHVRKTNQKRVAQFFGTPAEFGASANCLTFRRRDLELELNTADDFLYRMLLHYADEALGRQKPVAPDIVVKVEREIARDLHASQADVAKAIGMSVRSMARHLAQAGTTFLAVSDGYKAALAEKLLTGTDMQITEIAFALGYNSQSAFSTAFKRWTGQTPSDFRG